ncbi:MAG: putative guanosine-3',5'-bis(diphosphate) 3'-pyrophosphohydrolase MESH1 isoform X1 [Satyrvirus sp.]|uniref:Putative guanosine-3',5'-bis(Diphosphate) 3'-pyrophosphohydrolase MESH1 isoform X1 n=1 Tax=Satyrvirus sp. TaxID=2487771 RepID=A0A3G5AHM5_9VIRU|nr:MAG: putative guanosine-3',5'-bis(diphosphate) 3'-pyrophosphohydrolase MESH1 isoform X1 [Satyrvirus sp.]
MHTQIEHLMAAATFAANKHQFQRRKDIQGTPYINHPLNVANLIIKVGKVDDCNILVAAMLHDTVEDTNTSFSEIEKLFGPEIANIVKEVTDDKSLPTIARKKLQVENAPKKSYGAKMVKLADKLDNLTDLLTSIPQGWSDDRVIGYFAWSYKVIQGLRGTNEYLERELDNIFKKKFDPTDNLDMCLEKYYQLLEKK